MLEEGLMQTMAGKDLEAKACVQLGGTRQILKGQSNWSGKLDRQGM